MARRDLTGAVDFSVLETFTAGDPGITEEILVLFREQAAVWRPMLDAGSPGWRDAAHSIKGAAGGIGALRLADACGKAERAEVGMAGPALERVIDEMDRALFDVAAMLHELELQALRASS